MQSTTTSPQNHHTKTPISAKTPEKSPSTTGQKKSPRRQNSEDKKGRPGNRRTALVLNPRSSPQSAVDVPYTPA
jgi:hypothetical protein